MKRSLRIRGAALLAAALTLSATLGVSCRYDDSELVGAINDLNRRLTELEDQVSADINALQVILTALREQVTVASLVQNEDGSWTIAFTDGRKVTVSDGRDGKSAPVVSITEDGGQYWWVYVNEDGTFTYLTDSDGNRIPAGGKDAVPPQVRINPLTQEWEISTDGGLTWTATGVKARGEDGDSFFREVTQDEGYVYVTLADGTTLTLVRATELRFEFAATGVQYFERGEQRTVEVVSSGADKYSIAKPDGWRAVLTGEGMLITAPPDADRYAETEGKVSVVAVASNGLSTIAELQVRVGEAPAAVDLSAAGTANCYMVGAPGYYRFDATVQGNGAAGATIDGETFADYVPVMQPKRARIVWMTEPNMLSEAVCTEGRIYFTAPDPLVPGNALVAATDADDNILWSWHIWVTDYNADAGAQRYDNGYVMMDRDLGALDSRPGRLATIGLLYQWGRKDPFVGTDAVYTSSPGAPTADRTLRRPVYDAEGNRLDPYKDFPPVKAAGDGTIGSVAYATAHPATFIAGKNNTDWYDGSGTGYGARNNRLWGNPAGHIRKDIKDMHYGERVFGSTLNRVTDTVITRIDNVTADADAFVYAYPTTSRFYDPDKPQTNYYAFRRDASTPVYETGRKSIYDPCPPGWRVPGAGFWAGFNGESETWYGRLPGYYNTRFDADNMGRSFVVNAATGQTAWYQCSGSLSYGDGKFGNYDAGRYWTNEAGTAATRGLYNEPGESGLPAGYFYRWPADQDGSGTNANYNYFSAAALNVKIFYIPGLWTVEGKTMPQPSNMRYYGSQDMSGGAARSFAHSVRCMKE